MNTQSTSESEERRESRHIDRDSCLDLLHDLLSPAERTTILEHLTVCSECERLLQETAADREQGRATSVLRSEVREELAAEKPVETSPSERSKRADRHSGSLRPRVISNLPRVLRRPRYQIGAGLAVAAALLVMVLWPSQREIGDAPSLYWFPAYSSDVRLRTDMEAASDEDLLAGFEAYAEHSPGQAIELLRKAKASEQMETLRKIYLGSALAWSGEYEDAAILLESALAQALPDPWGSEARWTLYVAWMKSGREASADSLLHVLSKETGEIGDRARLFLEKQKSD